jgi:hypothetical protein
MKIKPTFIFLLTLFVPFSALAQDVVINELMSSNKSAILDEDGDSPDWFELYNPGSTEVFLGSFGISDDTSDFFKWVIPEINLGPQEYLLVFASGKDRNGIGECWETIIDWGDSWKYFVPQYELPGNWRLPGYDDSSWSQGPSGFGYGDDDDATIVDPCVSVYIRKTFSISQLPAALDAILHIDYDDAFVAYLNGQEIARANIGTPGTYPAWDELALTTIEPMIYQGGFPIAFNVDPGLLQPEGNVLAIEVHNADINSSDLTLIPFFTLLLESAPPDPNGVPALLQLVNPKLHTNFKLSAQGESLILTEPSGIITDSLTFGYLSADVSYGRQPSGSVNWKYFPESTPGMPNSTIGWPGITEPTVFSPLAGFYPGGIQVVLSTGNPEDVIYYTLTGDEPTDGSAVYEEPIYIFETTVIRALAVHPGYLPGKISTATFFINVEHELPIVSLSTAPANLFDPETGIYHENNIWEDWERPLHVEFFENMDSLGFSLDAGVKITGGWTRTLPQKSLAIYARESYGYGDIEYPLFPELGYDKYESFMLRNSGNDWGVTMFRDGFMTGLVKNDGVDIQAFRPTIVYINGEYWGIHNMRERMTDRYVEMHYGVVRDSLDLLEFDGQPLAGDAVHYTNMLNFIQTHPMSLQENYAYIKTQMDIPNFITYEVTQIFLNNTDWPGNNIKFWRPRTPDGKWRWMLYDTDFGFGLVNDYTYNTLFFATDPNGPSWPNPPWSTFLLRSLLTNQEFKTDFINRYADLLNSSFRIPTMISQIDEKKNLIINEMPEHLSRWGGTVWDWLNNINVLRDFANQRKNYAQNHVVNHFNLPEYSPVTLEVAPPQAGKIKISTLVIEGFPWTGEYFNGVEVPLYAVPDTGYRFVGWQGDFTGDSTFLSVVFSQGAEITAVFEPYTPDTVVINEINYHSADDFDTDDWIELYHPCNAHVDLSGWIFRDEDDLHSFVVPEETILPEDGYLVLCADTAAFHALFPSVTNYLGNFDFKLDAAGELIRLYDMTGVLIDTVHYNDELPWPEEADGLGPTLELIDPWLDNALADSWLDYSEHGTPGGLNGPFTDIAESPGQKMLECLIHPNPFKNGTELTFYASVEKRARIEVFSIEGKIIWEQDHYLIPEGISKLYFDGSNGYGLPVPPGVYLCRIIVDGSCIVRKMVKSN